MTLIQANIFFSLLKLLFCVINLKVRGAVGEFIFSK